MPQPIVGRIRSSVVPPRTPPHLSRRAVLLGGAGFAFLAACGNNGDGGAGDRGEHTQHLDLERLDDEAGALLAGFNFQGGYVATGLPQRLTFLLATIEGPRVDDVPDSLDFVLSLDGETVGDPITVESHADGVPTPYFPLIATFDRPGLWTATVDLDGKETSQVFTVDERANVSLLQVGETLPRVDTPTEDDPRGVEPICTDEPLCPLHATTLDQALAAGRPVALLVATPAYCQTGLCGPVLDLLVEGAGSHPDVQFIHAEVWADAAAKGGPMNAERAPIVDAVGLNFEPSLFLADDRGQILERLDNVYDRTELDIALRRLGVS
jgi:hypothetical protein